MQYRNQRDQTKPTGQKYFINKTETFQLTFSCLVKPLVKMSEDNLRQRRGLQEKEALRSRVEEMRRKMKVSEEKQERWNTAITFAK